MCMDGLSKIRSASFDQLLVGNDQQLLENHCDQSVIKISDGKYFVHAQVLIGSFVIKPYHDLQPLCDCYFFSRGVGFSGWFVSILTLYLIQTPFNAFANREDPHQATFFAKIVDPD